MYIFVFKVILKYCFTINFKTNLLKFPYDKINYSIFWNVGHDIMVIQINPPI